MARLPCYIGNWCWKTPGGTLLLTCRSLFKQGPAFQRIFQALRFTRFGFSLLASPPLSAF
jgi:hypothetical protein